LKTGDKVKYLGVKAKVSVILRRLKEEQDKEGKETGVAVEKAPAKKNVAKKTTSKKTEAPKVETKKIEEVIDFDKVVEEVSISEVIEEVEEMEVVEQVDEEAPKIAFSDLIQVPVRKLDDLMNLVGELVIERDRIMQLANDRSDEEGKSRLDFSRFVRVTSDLQYSVMDVRLVQVSFLFNKFHRVVRDAANSENKKVFLELEGTETEIDRNVLSIISDSMIHLIRNCVGHGIEKPSDRTKSGKSENGTITLKARNENDNVVIEIVDDGGGINPKIIAKKAIQKGLATPELIKQMTDKDIVMFIFEPGFSSMEQVTAISGRGVGMDVVKKSIDSIGGTVEVDSVVGKGTVITLGLPSSMAVKGTLLFELGNQEYAIPLAYTEAVVSFKKADLHKVSSGLMATYLDKTISIVFLHDLFELNDEFEVYNGSTYHQSFDSWPEDKQLDVVVVSHNGKDVGFVVDKLLQQKEIVEKPLMKPVDQVKLISGVTILGNGNVCLVLNVLAIVQHIFSPIKKV
jgi:two-component system chemotaxis sensor kinase CheA